MTISVTHRNEIRSAEFASGAKQPDSAVTRALPLFFENARQAAASGLPAVEEAWLRAILILEPDNFDGNVALVSSMLRRDGSEEAIQLAARLVERNPENALVLWQLGLALQLAGRHADAIAFYQRAHSINPSLPTLRNNLAAALDVAGHQAEALAMWEEAIENDASDVDAWTNLSRVRLRCLDLKAAVAAGERATQLAPSNPLALSNYSLALKEAQRWNDAEQMAQAAIAASPQFDRYSFNLSILHLVQGKYLPGWRGFETRWNGSAELKETYPKFSVPLWKGESLHGKTLLLWGEQGFGDVIQFCRFAPLLADRVRTQGGKLVWAVFRKLLPLMQRLAPDDVECIAHDHILPAFDFHVPLLSLPLAFNVDHASIPVQHAYLVPDVDRRMYWQEKLAPEKRLRVGLVWTGGLTHQRNMYRAVGIDRYIGTFGALKNIAFYSLQKEGGHDVTAARDRGFPIEDYTSDFGDFDDTAAFIDSLDLVITVCTSVAHLAAALGKPTWVLLDVNPHWVWQLERSDSPWYTSVSLYRQKEFGQWDPVLEALRRDLAAWRPESDSAQGPLLTAQQA